MRDDSTPRIRTAVCESGTDAGYEFRREVRWEPRPPILDEGYSGRVIRSRWHHDDYASERGGVEPHTTRWCPQGLRLGPLPSGNPLRERGGGRRYTLRTPSCPFLTARRTLPVSDRKLCVAAADDKALAYGPGLVRNPARREGEIHGITSRASAQTHSRS